MTAPHRQTALVLVLVALIYKLRRQQAEHGVAKKLQTLVIVDLLSRVIGTVRRVGQRSLQQCATLEGIPERVLQHAQRIIFFLQKHERPSLLFGLA